MRPGTERYQLPRENPSSSSSNLVIDPVVETDTGDYECWAKQDWGEGTVKTKLKVIGHLVDIHSISVISWGTFYNSRVEGADRAQARCVPAWLLRVRGSEEDLHCDSLPLRPTTRLSERRRRVGQVLRVRPVQGEDHLPRAGQPVYRATGVLLRPSDRPKLRVHLLLL